MAVEEFLRPFSSLQRKLRSLCNKTLREDHTAAERKMSLTRPAAGGEFRERNSFLNGEYMMLNQGRAPEKGR